MAMEDDRIIDLIRARLDRPLVLIGMMGSGKSRLGRMLANALGQSFSDSDEEIEKAAGCTISEIFERYGEPFFRDREQKIIERLLDHPDGVIATGGGAPMRPETMKAIRDKSISIWVRADISILVERTARHGNRPLLKGGDPKTILQDIAVVRDPVYRLADIIVESHDGPVSAILGSALEKLDSFLMYRDRDRNRHDT